MTNKKGPIDAKLSGVIKKIKKSEQMVSMITGILIVLLVGGLSYRFFHKKQAENLPESQGEEGQKATEKTTKEKVKLPTFHKVANGENLWQVAEKYYHSGYNWVDIARENKLADPDLVLIGEKLVIPDVAVKKLTIAELPKTGVVIAAQADHYIVQKGDSLSEIAGAAYGDIFSWPKIWSANRDKIHNPNLIFPAQELKIPR